MTSHTVLRDNTGQEHRNRRLELLDSIFRATPTGIGMERNRIIVQVNERLCAMTAYRADELLNNSARMLYPTREEFDWVGQEKNEQIARQGTATVETRWQQKGGGVIDVLLSAAPLDPNDPAIGVTFTVLDITARKQAEKTIAVQKYYLSILHDITLELLNRRSLNELLQTLVRGAVQLTRANDGFAYIVDDEADELVIRAACGRYERYLNGFRIKPGEGLAGKVWATGKTMMIAAYHCWENRMPDAFLGDLGAAICVPVKLREKVLGVIGLGHFESDRQFRPFDREALERLADLAAVGLDNAWLKDSLQGELAEKKKAAAVLQRYKQMVTASTDYMALVDRDYVYLEINQAFCKALGRTRGEIIGRQHAEVCGAAHFDKHYKAILDRSLAGQEVRVKEWHRTPGMGRRYIDTFYYPSREADDRITGVVVVGRDMTDLKTLEGQLLQSQKMEAIGTLAGGIAHDFNNILMGVQGRAALMAAEVNTGDSLREHIEAIESYVRNASALTNQLLGFAQGGKYETRITDLNDLVQRHNRMFGRTRKELTITEDFARDLPAAQVDRDQINQVLLNIYLNAWQAMPEGGTIRVKTAALNLDNADQAASGLQPGCYAVITVSDTGRGMDEAVCQRVFEPFFTTRPMGHGTGLGLASAYGIIKNHGGVITVSSEKGRGSAFSIYLPASTRQAEAVVRVPGRVHPGKGTVLLVDDEQMIVQVAEAMLAKLGYTVLSAADGEEALNRYRQEKARIDLVILDMVMPGMGGGETFERLKAIDPRVKVLLSSGYSLEGEAAKIMQRGCVGFLPKPFSLDQLSAKLKAAIA